MFKLKAIEVYYIFLLSLSQIISQTESIFPVDAGWDLIEPSDEGVLEPINDDFGNEDH